MHIMFQLADYALRVLLGVEHAYIPSLFFPSPSPSPLPHSEKRYPLLLTAHARPLSQDRAKWPPHTWKMARTRDNL